MQINSGAAAPSVSRRMILAGAVASLGVVANGGGALYDRKAPLNPGRLIGSVWHGGDQLDSSAQLSVATVPRRVSHPAMPDAVTLANWVEFRRRFLSSDGRVIDNMNGGVSHSEGQGWGMLFSVACNDLASFELIADWTKRQLQCRSDALHAWRYVPQSTMPVSDHNNATDGDLFIAAALWRAAWRWQRPDFAAAARDIAEAILQKLILEVGPWTVLRAGAIGFEQSQSVTINPSYYVFPLLAELATLCPSPKWASVSQDGESLLTQGRFGRWKLSPDWLLIDRKTGALSLDPQRQCRFSYDAIRVPLWLAWGGKAQAVTDDFVAYWVHHQPAPPAWIDLATSNCAPYVASAGMQAIGRIAQDLSRGVQNHMTLGDLPLVSASPDYYSAALTLLARCAVTEAGSA